MDIAAETTRLIRAARTGDRTALDALFACTYDEIRRIARGQLRHVDAGQTLRTTAVVHEAYLKLAGGPAAAWEDRAHFLAVAATAMRHVLLNYARRRATKKRGGGKDLALESEDAVVETLTAELVELDRALERLATVDERLVRVVDLRFFAGFSVEETARILGVTDRTVKRDWRLARMFLRREMEEPA